MNRRAFLSGIIAAPAVIRVAPLMRIAPVPLGDLDINRFFYGDGPLHSPVLWPTLSDIRVSAGAVRKYTSLVGFPDDCLYGELPSPLS